MNEEVREVREMTFEEEAALYAKEARALFDKETPGYEAPPINHTVRRGMRIIRKAREEIEWLEKRMQWISVEDRLPPEGERVLVCREVLFKGDKIIDIDARIHANSARTGTEWADNLRSWKSVVTHWMPLPSAEGL